MSEHTVSADLAFAKRLELTWTQRKMNSPDQPVPPDQLERQARLDRPGGPDLLVPPDLPDCQDPLETLDPQARKATKVLRVVSDLQALPVTPEPQDLRDLQVLQGHPEARVVHRALLVQMVPKVQKALRVQTAQTAQKVLLVLKDQKGQKDRQDPRDPRGLQDSNPHFWAILSPASSSCP